MQRFHTYVVIIVLTHYSIILRYIIWSNGVLTSPVESRMYNNNNNIDD